MIPTNESRDPSISIRQYCEKGIFISRFVISNGFGIFSRETQSKNYPLRPWYLFHKLLIYQNDFYMRNTFLLLLSLLAVTLTTNAQEPIQKRLPEALKKRQQENPEEKVYMQLDKDVYLPGEQIWLKLYLVDAYLHQPSFISSVAYVELINAQDSLIVRHTLDVTDGGAPGDINIPKDIGPGTYHLRAYT